MKKNQLLSKLGKFSSFTLKKKGALTALPKSKDGHSFSLSKLLKLSHQKSIKQGAEPSAQNEDVPQQKARFGTPQSAVFLFHNGYTLSGLVCSRNFKGELSTTATTSSRHIAPNEAVQEIVSTLEEGGGGKIPSKAYLVSSLAMSSLVHLPVYPRKPRPKMQMAEMIRWEMEDSFMAHSDLYTLESILMGRGSITLAERIELTAQSKQGGGSEVYAEIAGQDTVMDCLSLQESVIGEDDEQVCAWQGQLHTESGDEGYTYLAAALGESVRDSWVGACKKAGLSLQTIFPEQGIHLSFLQKKEEHVLTVEVSQEQITSFRLSEDGLERMSTRVLSDGNLSADELISTIRDLIHEDIDTIYIHGAPDKLEPFEEVVRQKCETEERRVVFYNGLQKCKADYVTCSLLAAVYASFSIASRHLVVGLQAVPPKPPLWKNRALWPWIAIFGVALGIIGSHIYLTKETKKNEWALELLNIDFAKKKKIKSEISRTANETKKLEAQLQEIEKKIAEEQRLAGVLNTVIKKRQDMVPSVLESLARAINNQVVLLSVEENDDRQGFYVSGWSVRDSAAQLFGTDLNRELVDWGYKVADIKVERCLQKRKGLAGYDISIWLVKMSQQEVIEMKTEFAKEGGK